MQAYLSGGKERLFKYTLLWFAIFEEDKEE